MHLFILESAEGNESYSSVLCSHWTKVLKQTGHFFFFNHMLGSYAVVCCLDLICQLVLRKVVHYFLFIGFYSW